MKAYSYVRFSTADQIKGDSQRRQTEAAAEWCERNKVELVDSYRDLGVSAFRGKNAQAGALSAFLKLAKSGRIPAGSFLIVESLDRLSRTQIMDAFDLFRDIIRTGIKIVTLCDGHVYDRAKIDNGGFVDLIVSLTVLSRAHEESAMKSQRVSAAWDAKRRRLGTEKMTRMCPKWLKLSDDRSKFILIPDRVRLVQRIFDLAVHGKGINGIAKQLRRERVPTFSGGKAWYVQTVRRIITSPAVIGTFVPAIYRDGKRILLDPVEDYYPAIVKKEVFATVAQRLKAHPSFRGRSSFNVFSGLAYDRDTGTKMTYSITNKKKGWHYLIPVAAKLGQASYHSWNYDQFLMLFLIVCQKAALEKAPSVDTKTSRIAALQLDIDGVEKQIERLVDFISQRGASPAVDEKLRRLEERKRELQSEIADVENAAVANHPDVSKIDWKDKDALRENLRSVVRRIVIDAKSKSFSVEFLDGRIYGVKVKDGNAEVMTDPITCDQLRKASLT